MQRLIIHLKRVDKVTVKIRNGTKKKIFNTLNFLVKNEAEIIHHLSIHSRNTKSYRLSFCKT